MSSTTSALQRLPTLYEVLNRKTCAPVDLWSFYLFMRDEQRSIDYLDFWLDAVQHLSLCRYYVRGLRQSIMLSDEAHPPQAQAQNDTHKSTSSSVLLDALIQGGVLDDNDAHRLSCFLRGDELLPGDDEKLFRVTQLIEQYAEMPDHLRNQELESPSKVYDRYSHTSSNFEPDEQRLSSIRAKSQLLRDSFRSSIQSPTTPSENAFPQHAQSDPQQLQPNPQTETNLNVNDNKQQPQQSAEDLKPNHKRTITPELLEQLFPSSSKGPNTTTFVSRQDIRDSSRRLLVTYFIPGAEREIVIPPHIIQSVRHAVEIEGRDDPEVFDEAREYVFQAMEKDAFPIFLQYKALGNLSPQGSLIRLVVGLVCLWVGFWLGFIFIFLDWKPKSTRVSVIIPFGIGLYYIICSLYNLDPIVMWLGYSEQIGYSSQADINTMDNTTTILPTNEKDSPSEPNFSSFQINKKNRNWFSLSRMMVKIKEPFVYKLLLKRSGFVSVIIAISVAIMTCIFALVPGKRL